MRNRKAASPAISMVIITATTIVLVLVASSYAYQVLERQRGASEFETVKKSFATFDDAVRDVAWDREGIRSARFTVQHGFLELIPNDSAKGLNLTISIDGYPARYSTYIGYLRYNISTNYVTYGYPYKSYLWGDERTVASKSSESFGVALIEQKSSMVSLKLYYRVRVVRSSVVQVNNKIVNYVDILIIKITAAKWSTYIGDFDLKAENIGITTLSRGPYPLIQNSCDVSVMLGESSNSTSISLDYPGDVVFNFVVAEVSVST
jgi:hypothetical protein